MMKKIFFLMLLLNSSNALAGVIVSDAFTETTSKNLASHVPTTTGTSWAEDYDTCTSNYYADASWDYARSVSALTDCIMMYSPRPTPSGSRYDIQVDYIDDGDVLTTDAMGIFARWTDSSNYYSLGVVDDAGNAYRLYKMVGGTSTSLASGGTFSDGDFGLTIVMQMKKSRQIITQSGGTIITNTDNSLRSAGRAGIWCGQAQVSGEDCSDVEAFDNLVITQYSEQVVDLDFATEAWADDKVWDGRWYISPVVHAQESRMPKVAVVDARCSWSANIGDFDVEDEWSLIYAKCSDYSRLDQDGSLMFLYAGDLHQSTKSLSVEDRSRLEGLIRQKNPSARLNSAKPVSEWLNDLGRVINPEFNAENLYVR